MICPHCNRLISYKKSDALKKKALKFLSEGYSTRDVEQLLKREVSFGTIAKWKRESIKPQPTNEDLE